MALLARGPNMDPRVTEALPFVRATLNYLKRPDTKPYIYTFEPPHGTPPRSGETDAIPNVPIYNARPLKDRLSLDREGFLLQTHKTAVGDFCDEAEIKSVYYAEVVRLLKEITGAEEVVVFDHTLRCQRKFEEKEKGVRAPVRAVHNDYTVMSGPQRVRDLLDAKEAERRLKSRFAEVNVWRPVRGPVEELPLAVCDAQSISPADLIPTDLIYRGRSGEIYNLSYSPSHRWLYFPRMQSDEVVLIKGYDSEDDGRARFTAHTAFEDPATPPGAASRESIEARALLFF